MRLPDSSVKVPSPLAKGLLKVETPSTTRQALLSIHPNYPTDISLKTVTLLYPQELFVTQDIVTRGAKFLFMYKRPGKRVIVNDLGRLMVSPTSMEASVQQSTAGDSFPETVVMS